jgi:hypothetical protein
MATIRRLEKGAALWLDHPLGPPNQGHQAVYESEGHRFALGRYSQHADPRIISIVRHLVLPDAGQASAALAALRRVIRRDFPGIQAVQTYTDKAHAGTSYIADGWVFVANHGGKRRWIRTL